MNFDDTPQEAEFRSTARKWIDANAPKKYEAELSKSSLGRIRLVKEEIVDVGKRFAGFASVDHDEAPSCWMVLAAAMPDSGPGRFFSIRI